MDFVALLCHHKLANKNGSAPQACYRSYHLTLCKQFALTTCPTWGLNPGSADQTFVTRGTSSVQTIVLPDTYQIHIRHLLRISQEHDLALHQYECKACRTHRVVVHQHSHCCKAHAERWGVCTAVPCMVQGVWGQLVHKAHV